MSPNNRILGRAVLFGAGVLALAAGTALLLWAFARDTLTAVIAQVGAIVQVPMTTTIATPWGLQAPLWSVIASATALFVLLFSVIFISSRRRGTTRTALRSVSEQGVTNVDTATVGEFFEFQLDTVPELLGVSATTYRGHRERTILMELFVRDGANLSRVLDSAHTALRDWDRMAGTDIPVILRVGRQRIRDRLRPPIRAR